MYSNLRLTCFAAAVAALTACGGGGGGTGDGTVGVLSEGTTNVPVTVMDGLISGAAVCLDVNGNGACETGDILAATPTDARGNTTITVPNGDVGKYPVVAVVPVGAVDAITGPVTTAYLLSAPADQTALVSPLTTIVQLLAASSGVSSTMAEHVLQTQGGLPNSPLANYLAANDNVSANAARVLVAAVQQQTETLKTSVGQPDSNGVAITEADVQKAIASQMRIMLATAVKEANASTVVTACTDKTSADCRAAFATAVGTVVTAKGITADTLGAMVALGRMTTMTTASAAPAAGFQLDGLNFGDTNNWYTRVVAWTTAEDTPDANGLVRSRSIRHVVRNGVEKIWGNNSNSDREGDLHWSGSAWVGCTADLQTLNTVRDVKGADTYNYCDSYIKGASQRMETDVSGKSMSSVFSFIQSVRGDSNWGKAPTWFNGTPAATVDGAIFPVGSKLYAQTDVYTETALTYDVRASNVVQVAPADVSVGGDARSDKTLPCYLNYVSSKGVTLDLLIARSSGTPCLYNPSDSSVTSGNGQVYGPGPVNENWQATTVSLSKVGTDPTGAATARDFYTTNTLYRLSFTGGGSQAVTFYACKERVNNGAARNCTAIGTGTYAITTLGDARVMTFTGFPTQMAPIDFETAFIERGGETYYGFKVKLTAGRIARLNGTAGNAVLSQLGLATVAP